MTHKRINCLNVRLDNHMKSVTDKKCSEKHSLLFLSVQDTMNRQGFCQRRDVVRIRKNKGNQWKNKNKNKNECLSPAS